MNLSRRTVCAGLALTAALGGCTAMQPTVPVQQVDRLLLERNTYTANQYRNGVAGVRIVRPGETWESLFGERALLARYANRQNVTLFAGQAVITPARSATFFNLSPFPQTAYEDYAKLLVFDPRTYAWALYQRGQLLRWGPAVGGSDFCADVGRPCRTTVGNFRVTEVAGPRRRSNAYPPILAAEGRGALMPYYMRITSGGIGFHARYMRGRHESHGCIGMFYDDAQWLNLQHAEPARRSGGLRVTVLPYA